MKPDCKLTGTNGNVFAIIGKISKVLKKAGQKDKALEFEKKAFACASYDDVLKLTFDYVEVS